MILKRGKMWVVTTPAGEVKGKHTSEKAAIAQDEKLAAESKPKPKPKKKKTSKKS